MNSETKIKLLTFYTPSHQILFDNYFKPSFDKFLSNDFDLIAFKSDQKSEKVSFYESGWKNTVKEKIVFVRKFIENNMDQDFFVFSDCDISFQKNIKEEVLNCIKNQDMLFQDDVNMLNSGFYICKINNKTKYFFDKVLDEYDDNLCDQKNINKILKKNKNMIKFKKLPKNYFTIRQTMRGEWNPHKGIKPPKYDLSMFHANWTRGIDNKIKLLEYFKNWNKN